ncbi:hypothetical protein HNQ60_005153 [Povalibacter uvarum]|uniref:Ice-binding protein C-terminal domain-containing protein n=1 Tax=Povalibacter uvarum TaxID=732238 RepID=A0A841HS74_9GAMM|nr:PEP-CTERM sorting domain-containing protein [Povalibacter uvarum]MBB6096231.1 hypothetical protein [Povalibacter uvarum]
MSVRRVVALSLLVNPLAVLAVPITFEFGGTITANNPNVLTRHLGYDEFPSAVVGEAFKGEITFDSQNYVADPCCFGTSVAYEYADAGKTGMVMNVTFGGFTLQTDASLPPSLFLDDSHSEIRVLNDGEVAGQVYDHLSFMTQTVLPSGNWSGAYSTIDGEIVESSAAFIAIDLDSRSGGNASVLGSTDLPTVPPDLEGFGLRQFSILGGFPNVFIRGEIEYLRLATPTRVPEPGPLMLVAAASIGLLFRRRKLRKPRSVTHA